MMYLARLMGPILVCAFFVLCATYGTVPRRWMSRRVHASLIFFCVPALFACTVVFLWNLP